MAKGRCGDLWKGTCKKHWLTLSDSSTTWKLYRTREYLLRAWTYQEPAKETELGTDLARAILDQKRIVDSVQCSSDEITGMIQNESGVVFFAVFRTSTRPKRVAIVRDKRAQWRYIIYRHCNYPAVCLYTIPQYDTRWFWSIKNLAEMRRIFSRGWKPRASLFLS